MPWKKGSKWIAQVRKEESRIQKVFATKAEAQAWEVEQKGKPASQWKTLTGFSLRRLINEYLDYSKIKHSKKTYEEKLSLFRKFFCSIRPDSDLRSCTTDMVRIYLQERASKKSGYSANKDRKNLMAFGGWVRRYKNLTVQCFSETEKFPEERQARYIPPEEDFWKIYEVAQGQDKIMLLAYLHLAARRNELFRLTWDDIDFGTQKVRLTTRKRKDGSWEQDYLPMTKDLFTGLSAHREFVGGDWVFPGPGGRPYKYRIHFMGRLCERAAVRPFGFHAIRHLSASILAGADVPMIHIQAILRHKNLGTTERYLHRLTDIRESMEKAFQKTHDGTV